MLGTFEDDTSVPAEIREIRVTGSTGSVDVRPGPGAGVNIHRRVHCFRPFQPRPGATHRVEGDVLHLDTNEGTRFPFFVAVDYVVEAPPGVRVIGGLTAGRLRLTGTSAVDVTTTSGSIALTGITGEIAAHTTSGSISGRELHSATIDADTTSGKLSLDLAEPGDVRARATSGAITVTVPDAHYRIDTKVTSGRTRIRLPNDPDSPHHLDLSATSGAITVAER